MPRPLKRWLLPGLLLLAFMAIVAPATAAQEVTDQPVVILSGVPFGVSVTGAEENSTLVEVRDAQGNLLTSGAVAERATETFDGIVINEGSALPLQVHLSGSATELAIPFAPGWYSLVPPAVAILLALLFKEVITALLIGVFSGVLAITSWNPIDALWRLSDTYVIKAITDQDSGHTQIIVFSLLLGALVGIVGRNGGTRGIVEAVAPLASTRKRGKVASWLSGLAIFFDDYANTLIIGNTMRPITDRLKISREKLAFIVDSTAAPVAALVPVSTWVGYEISLIGNALGPASNHIPDAAQAETFRQLEPFVVFLDTIPYLFYPLLALAFVGLTSMLGRDFGPMAKAEIRAATGGGLYRPGAILPTDTSGSFLQPKEGHPFQWWNAGIPVATVVLVVLGGLYISGKNAAPDAVALREIFGAADPFATLLWGSLAGVLVAAFLSIGQRILSVHETVDAGVAGMKSMVMAMAILTLAWSLGAVTKDMGTAQYLAQAISDSVPLGIVPALVFIIAGAMAFATGTSWATMAILIPLVIPLSVSIAVVNGVPEAVLYSVLYGSVSSVLAGAIWGDHCSPISDTTVLSSMATGCDHIDHVKTQLPYAMTVGVVALLLGSVGTAYGLPNWIALLGGVGILFGILVVFGTKVPDGGDQLAEEGA